ncbi:thiosulfate oxidation carrier complex protein SoxZ [Pseudoroseomonas ludipueritiae]|uniref:Thiosulfate oxidation carrier complex protein SoxZ n=1 Tax=Pseudoroseomonas ludipueritiae TaxID=198093 RepID=A0ABR7RDV8_9PROT|nr:thiosulfate oxidation carrier complex protein SoxZ [Pseudoroseomonas ludipueritiae]MBC9179625.1 thiosulfate oxidation carrier complex protein SoxZ [Pseudoroseomonas ludipueritiae]MCG7362696.1 thiosulfate oxidation carrier complex protein SoxZ [Roseomonas sp. ACRSG]
MQTAPITARITLPPSAQRGEVVTVRVLVRHPMERAVDAPGLTPVPQKILHTLRVTYAGEEVFRMTLSPGIAANPYLEFTTVATETGDLVFTWEEDGGTVYRREARLVVT